MRVVILQLFAHYGPLNMMLLLSQKLFQGLKMKRLLDWLSGKKES